MSLNYQKIDGQIYAKVAGHSVRRNGKIIKEGVVYLGRVIDRDHHVFYNRERGIYTYDPDTGIYGKADECYVSDLTQDSRRKERTLLDFGDSFFLDSLIHLIGYDKVIDQMKYRNKDTLYAMIQYYILCSSSNSHAVTWYEGSFCSIQYPNANLTSQRITDFLQSIGEWENMNDFFDLHIRWIKDKISRDNAILIDSTGLPNNIHFPLTAVSNHNGKVSREVRMTTVLQRNTGYPLFFRITPGNIVDMSTLTRSVNELYMHDINTDFIIVDAGYYTNDNIEELYFCEIDFLTRLPEKYDIYREVVEKYAGDLQKEENMIRYNGRYVYIKRAEVKIGSKGHTAYAYLGYDIDRGNDESHKAVKRAEKNKSTPAELHKELQKTGLFVIISSLSFSADEILPAYYTRQIVEQYFDISKGSSKLTPLRVHSEEALYGHLILSMIAATINVYIQNRTKQIYDDRDAIFMTLRNQKCSVRKNGVSTMEPQRQANLYYDKFGIECPFILKSKDGILEPQHHLLQSRHSDM